MNICVEVTQKVTGKSFFFCNKTEKEALIGESRANIFWYWEKL